MNTQLLNGYDKYVLFGTRPIGIQALRQFREAGIEVACFCDNDESKWNTKIDGVKVISPLGLQDFVSRENALTVVCSSYAKHLIAIQLEEMNIPYIYFSKPIFVEITSFCNQACTFCPYEYIKRPKSHLNPKLMKEFLHDLKSENSDILYPTVYPHVMGEPLVCKHFFDFMDTCKELGFYVCVVTNWALLSPDIQKRLFTEYPDLDIVLSLQGPTKKVFEWRKEKKLTYEQWIDIMFEVMEAKFKYAHHGAIQISTIFPDRANKLWTRSDCDLHLFEWYDSMEEFTQWKRDFGGRCAAFNDEMRQKYPENYETIKDATSPVSYYFNLYNVLKDLEQWVNTDEPAQFEFAPNIHIYSKKFGIWGVEEYFKSLIPNDKYLHYEENYHALTEKCDRVGDVALLSSGQLVSCCIDNEADFVFADLNKGEKYSDAKTQERIRELRDNLSLSQICRRCKARALVFDKTELNEKTQPLTHYGIRWHGKRENDSGEVYRASYELSYIFAFPRIDANFLTLDIASLQDKKQFTLIKILDYDEETELFTERKNYSMQLKPGERTSLSIPYEFEKGKLHRVDFITATQRINDKDDGVAVYSACLRV